MINIPITEAEIICAITSLKSKAQQVMMEYLTKS
jgi:hypothetical protein